MNLEINKKLAISGSSFCMGMLTGMYDDKFHDSLSLTSGLMLGGTSLVNLYFGAAFGAQATLEKHNATYDLSELVKDKEKVNEITPEIYKSSGILAGQYGGIGLISMALGYFIGKTFYR